MCITNIEIFADGADLTQMIAAYKSKTVQGFTTNPSLMRAAGVKSYTDFARTVVAEIPDLPVSFEVVSKGIQLMEREAHLLSECGSNVYVKIPIINYYGSSCLPLIKKLSDGGINLNVTAVFTTEQVNSIKDFINPKSSSIVSIFAGRIADIGIDPEPIVLESARLLKDYPRTKLLWASSREIFNVVQAQRCNCDIITIPPEILKKMILFEKSVGDLSLETVRQFYDDAKQAGYLLW